MITDLTEVLDLIADGPFTAPDVAAAISKALDEGCGLIEALALKPGDDVGYVDMDVFGYAPVSSLKFAKVLSIKELRGSSLLVTHGGGTAEVETYDYALVRPN